MKFNAVIAPLNDDSIELCHQKLSPFQHVIQVLQSHVLTHSKIHTTYTQ